MKLSTFAFCCGLCLTIGFAAPLCAAEATPERADASAAETAPSTSSLDVQDLFIMAPLRPIFVRLHIQRGAESYQQAWTTRLLQLFRESDKDHSGDLDDQEYADGPFENLLGNRRGPSGEVLQGAASLLDVDIRPIDARVSFAEFIEAFGSSCLTASGAEQLAGGGGGGDDLLLKMLDRDGTPGLSSAESASALALFLPYDTNDDELLSLSELSPRSDPRNQGRSARVINGRVQAASPGGMLIVTPLPGSPIENLAQTILSAYDRPDPPAAPPAAVPAAPGGAGAVFAQPAAPPTAPPSEYQAGLSASEFDIAPLQFAAADLDTNGELNLAELTGWLRTWQPDLEVNAQPEDVARDDQLTVVGHGSTFDVSEGDSQQKRKNVVLSSKRVRVELTTQGPPAMADADNQSKQRFQRVDQDKNDYLDTMEFQRGGFNGTFAMADADGDGKVFIEELIEGQKLQMSVAQSRVSLSATDQGSTLPEILDTSRDTQLSPRELADLSRRVADWDQDGNGHVTADEVPRQYLVTIAPGTGAVMTSGTFVVTGNLEFTGQMPAKKGDGPEWFYRMDRNADGDISRREFLGPLEMFDRADADHNGLLDIGEATSLEKP